jgi:hypothetical protein
MLPDSGAGRARVINLGDCCGYFRHGLILLNEVIDEGKLVTDQANVKAAALNACLFEGNYLPLVN